MYVNIINMFMAIFAAVVTLAAMLGPGRILTSIDYDFGRIQLFLGANIMYLIAVGTEAFIMGKPGYTVHILMIAANFLQYLLLYVLSNLVTYHLGSRMRDNGLAIRIVRPFYCVYIVPYFLLLCNFVTGNYFTIGQDNLYYRGPWFLLSQGLGVLCQLSGIVLFVYYRRYLHPLDLQLFMPFMILPTLAVGLQIVSNGLNVMIPATTVSCLIVSLGGMFLWSRYSAGKNRELEQMKACLEADRKESDFLCNTLADISQLCKNDPGQVSPAIDCFADFLRKCMNDVTGGDLKPFREELAHLQNYLNLEKLRYGEDLEVIYELEEEEFRLPVQVLQQMAEFLIRFIMKEQEAAYVMTIRTYRGDGHIWLDMYDENFGRRYRDHSREPEMKRELDRMKTCMSALSGATLDYIHDAATGNMLRITLDIPV